MDLAAHTQANKLNGMSRNGNHGIDEIKLEQVVANATPTRRLKELLDAIMAARGSA